MSGWRSGVATRLKALAKHALYVHCHAHRLNLVLVDTAKSVRKASDFFALLEKLYVFISGSYVHAKWKQIQIQMYPGEAPHELPRLYDTRWACRYFSCRNVRDHLPAILHLLQDISKEDNAHRAIDARGLHVQIHFQFGTLLTIFCSVLGETKSALDMMQSPNVDCGRASEIIQNLKDELQVMRSSDDNNKFRQIWQKATDLATRCRISTEFGETRPVQKRILPDRLKDSLATEQIVEQRTKTTRDLIRLHVYYPILDVIITELDRRFSNENCAIMTGIQALNPGSPVFLQVDAMRPFAEAFSSNSEDLVHELHQARWLTERKSAACPNEKPDTLLK